MGLIGGSIGLALKRTGFGGRLVGVSRPATIARALELGVVDEGWGYDELEQALKGADLVFICTPIKRILTLIAEVGRLAEPGTLGYRCGEHQAAHRRGGPSPFQRRGVLCRRPPDGRLRKGGRGRGRSVPLPECDLYFGPRPAGASRPLPSIDRALAAGRGASDGTRSWGTRPGGRRYQPPAADAGDLVGVYGRATECRARSFPAAGCWWFPAT